MDHNEREQMRRLAHPHASSKSHSKNDPVLEYCNVHSTPFHTVLDELMAETRNLAFGGMMGAKEVLLLNGFFIKLLGAKKILDVGVFTGVSALAAALSIPEDGIVIGCDVNEDTIKIGRPFWRKAGVEDKIKIHIQPAVKTLDSLITDGQENTFDFAFIDADKESYKEYYERCLRLLRKGGVIAFDNTLQHGRVLLNDEEEREKGTPEHRIVSKAAIQRLNDFLISDDRIQVVMLKMADGLTLVRKK